MAAEGPFVLVGCPGLFQGQVSFPALSGYFGLQRAWQMTSLEIASADGAYSSIPYSGMVIFTEGGTLSVQASNANSDAEDMTYTMNGYEAYYGPVVVDDKAGTFTITSSLVRALEGQSLVRNFEVTDDQLVLTPVDASEGWRVTYDRE